MIHRNLKHHSDDTASPSATEKRFTKIKKLFAKMRQKHTPHPPQPTLLPILSNTCPFLK
ncbi:hypothetical protein ED352_07585 [Muribaculaceae bacterium Isolate-002 (NCI)]|nr:hypothetical protein ED352_07585 [Muribaculaceae bacterium Isolate-002 (NCI)]